MAAGGVQPVVPVVSGSARRWGMAGALGAAVGWGLAGVFVVLAATPPLVLVAYRMWLGAAVLVAVLAAGGRRLTWRAVRVAAPGGVALWADMTLFFASLRLTSVAVATVISALQPLLVLAVAGPLLGERVGLRRAVLGVVAVAGVSVTVVGAGVPAGGHLRGDALAVGSLLAWSGYFLAAKRASRRCDPLEYTAGATLVGGAAAAVAVAAAGTVPVVHPGAWLWLGLLVVVPSGAHLLMNWAHHRVDAGVSSVLLSVNPVVASAGAWVVLGQRLGAVQVAGAVVCVVAVSLVARPAGD